MRFHLQMKTSTDETARLLSMVLQQELRQVGIALDIQSYEFATFYADISQGRFGLYSLRWIGGNEDPDIFRYALATASEPPHGANRGDYSNPEVDALLQQAAESTDAAQRHVAYAQVQSIVARDLPVLPLWYTNSEVIYNRRLTGITPAPSGSFDFLRTASVHP